MRNRSLGWELHTFLIIVALVVVGLVTHQPAVIHAALWICALAAPVAVLSFVVRLVVGIVSDGRRRLRGQAALLAASTSR